MKILKKLSALALVSAFVISSAFSAFAAAKTEAKKEAYSFTYEEKKVELGADAQSTLKALGKYEKEQVLTNCADDSGVDKVYLYKDFDLYTSKVDGKTIVNEITISKKDVPTEEGLKVGDTKAEVKKLYPEAKGELGLYSLTLGKTKLTIDCGLNDDKVVSITYSYVK